MVFELEKYTLGTIIRLYIKRVKGLDNVPKNGAYILAINHSSYMDHLMVQYVWAIKFNKVIHFLAKKEHFRGIQKVWHKHFQAIPVDRKAGKEALEIAISYLKKGKIIGIYPEGTRTLTGILQKAKTGVARLALIAKVPVVPIGLIGTFEMLPKGKIFPRFKRATVSIGKPMFFDMYYGKENNREVLRLVATKIMREIAKLAEQKYELE